MSGLNDDFIEMCPEMHEILSEASLNTPRVIAAKKKKFLQGIGANEQLDETLANVAAEDENLPIHDYGMCFKFEVKSKSFDDSIVLNEFEQIKPPLFDLKTYISCVKNLYSTTVSYQCISYLLCNARSFNEPHKPWLKFSEHGEEEVHVPNDELDITNSVVTQSRFTAKLIALMDALLAQYDESKYQKLNLNVTYLVLFMVTKLFKSKSTFWNAIKNPDTNKKYYTLCPRPLCENLPCDVQLRDNQIQGRGPFLTLVLYAYHTSEQLTKRILDATCMSILEFNGLGLPKMFNQIVKLYNVPETVIWDVLCFEHNHHAMFALADLYYSQLEGKRQESPKSYTLFPYCRLLNDSYHANLACGCPRNKLVCYIMACLIDKKIGYAQSHVRKSKWIEKGVNHIYRRKGENMASEIYSLLDIYDAL